MEVRESDAADVALALDAIGPNDLRHVWDQVEPLLERACEYSAGEMTPEAVVHGLGVFDGMQRMQMLALHRGGVITSVMVTQVSQYPTPEGPWVRKLDCLLVSGRDVEEWMPFEDQMDTWARAMGCVAVRIPRARKGWVRVLAHWKRMTGDVCVMEREL